MPTLWITEYSGPGREGPAVTQAPALPEIAVQTVTIAGVSDESAALNANTHLVRLFTDTACHVAFGPAPVATVASTPLAEGGELFLDATKAQGCLVAVIEA